MYSDLLHWLIFLVALILAVIVGVIIVFPFRIFLRKPRVQPPPAPQEH